MKRILFATSEAVPFIKTGGLADVAGSLPKCFDKSYFDTFMGNNQSYVYYKLKEVMRPDEISHTITGKTEMHCRSLLIRAKKMMNQRGLIRFDRNFVLLRRKLLTNAQLKRLINKIEVDKDGNVDIYLRLIGELGLDETVLIEGNDRAEETEDKTALNRHDHT